MATTQRLKLRDAARLIDAEFSVEVTGPSSFEIVVESSGGPSGSRPPRNSEYPEGLTEILRRVTLIASTLDDCLVVSRVARYLQEADRRVPPSSPYSYPIALSPSEDFARLRLALTSPQGGIASKARTGGNSRKNIALRFTARQPNLTKEQIVEALGAESSDTPRRDRKDIAVGITTIAIDAARQEWREIGADAFHAKYQTSRAAKFIVADPDGTEYDAKAILYAARVMSGLDGHNSDFDGDRQTVMEPLAALGYVVEDISAKASELPTSGTSEDDRKRAIEQARAFVGQTDATVERRVRREQRLLRRALGLNKGSHACALCGRTYPDRLLVAAHIKKRSECTEAEKVDIPAVAIIACALGCDALFEHGYVVVNQQGKVEATSKSDSDPHLQEMVSRLDGKRVTGYHPDSEPYFAWHRKNS